jgi:membrane-bound ClpP family serine protease
MVARSRGGVDWRLRGALLITAACVGALVGVVATFAHQSMPPLGIALALITSAVFLIGVRLAAPSRAGVVGAVIGLLGVTTILAADSGGSLVVPGNPVGYTWLVGVMALSAITVSWPRVQRPPRRPRASMNENLSEKETVAP